MANPYRDEKISNWVSDFCETEDAVRAAPAVQRVSHAALVHFLQRACAARDVDPGDIGEADVRVALLEHLPRLDIAQDAHAGMPALVAALLGTLESQGRLGGGRDLGAFARALKSAYVQAARPVVSPVKRQASKLGPNDPCPCGSGKKYKKCCKRLGRS